MASTVQVDLGSATYRFCDSGVDLPEYRTVELARSTFNLAHAKMPTMSLKSFPYKWTCLLGLIFLGSILWSATLRDEPSFLFGILSFLGLFVSVMASITVAIAERSKTALYRVLITVTLCLLIIPTIRLGGFFQERLFLMHLTRFQEVTNFLTEKEAARLNHGDTVIMTGLPSSYSDLHVADRVLISSKQKNITVRYVSRDSSALGHSGYMYRSDDDPAALEREFPNVGYRRIVPHWFSFLE